jgi:hypothetical protein
VWGNCSTVEHLRELVPPAARKPCHSAPSEPSCHIAAPLCKWEPKASDKDNAGNDLWPEGACKVWGRGAGGCTLAPGRALRALGALCEVLKRGNGPEPRCLFGAWVLEG